MQPILPRRRHTERAHHAKRLPQVEISGPPPAVAPGLPLTAPVTITLPRSRPTPAAGSASQPVQPPVRPAAPSSSASPITVFGSPDPTPDAGSNAPTLGDVSGAAKNSSRTISDGAIAGAVIAILFLIGAIIVVGLRIRARGVRQRKGEAWRGAIFPKTDSAAAEKNAQFTFQSPPPAPVLPPPISYNNTAPTSFGAPAAPSSSTATVRCTFIPTLPDELSITTGESIRILSEYDDGWALCANSRGEQGMVPLECLGKSAPTLQAPPDGSDWRNAQRASSLISPGGPRY